MSEEKSKPAYDEQTLAKLLEAAYVLQEHNRERRRRELSLEMKRDQLEAKDRATSGENPPSAPHSAQSAPPADYTLTLGRIVATQHQIQVHQLDLQNAISLIAERVIEISAASGAAIGVLKGDSIEYQGAAGRNTLAVGTTLPANQALCFSCIETSQVLRCDDVSLNSAVDPEECRRRGIQSLIAAPIFYQGTVAGGLELYYSSLRAFTDQDVHTCQLMAGLVTEALVRGEEVASRNSLASERAAMLEALEKLQPNLSALVEQSSAKSDPLPPASSASTQMVTCRKCGNQLLIEEQFCGECGSPQNTHYEAPGMQSRVAAIEQVEQTEDTSERDVPRFEDGDTSPLSEMESDGSEMEALLARALESQGLEDSAISEASQAVGELPAELLHFEKEPTATDESSTPEEDASTAVAVTGELTHPADWSSAAAARQFLEQLVAKKNSGAVQQFWNARRGDIYLAISVILVVCVVVWGISSKHSVGATGTQNAASSTNKKPADSDPTFLDRLLIQLGLADAPEPTEDKGNPATQVWIDQRTALYYCPGADLYGKTPKGKFTSQREAQLDQFQPAYRKTCD